MGRNNIHFGIENQFDNIFNFSVNAHNNNNNNKNEN
jgi:hypothetical protein